MKRVIKFFVSSIIVGVVIFVIFYAYVFYNKYQSKRYYEKIKNNQIVYVYDTIHCVLNSAMYIKNIKYKNDFIKYYKSLYKYYDDVEKGCVKKKLVIYAGDTLGYEEPIPITFPIKYMSFPNPVFFIGYTDKDSLIAEVVDFNTDCWGYIRGYVYFTNVHKTPPSDWRLKKSDEDYEKYKKNRNEKEDEMYEKPSEYGVQCW